MIPPPRPCDIFKISEKPSLNLKLFFNQKIEAETFRNLQNHKKSLNSTFVPRPKLPQKIAMSHVFCDFKE